MDEQVVFEILAEVSNCGFLALLNGEFENGVARPEEHCQHEYHYCDH
jgi:hypothetical protein